MISSVSLCYDQFCILLTSFFFLFFPICNIVLLYATFWSSRLLFLSSFRKEGCGGEMSRRDGTMAVRSILRFCAPTFENPFFRSYESFFPLCVSFVKEITKNKYTKLIWYLSSLFVAFCSYEIILVSRDHPDNALISPNEIGGEDCD